MPSIHAIFGPIGAGKSTFALQLAEQHDALRFSTDDWFRNLFFADMDGMPDLNWTFERISRCESQIWEIAKQAISLGTDVVFDLGLQKVSDRDRIRAQCSEIGIHCKFYCLNAERSLRQSRVVKRNEGTGDTFAFAVSPEMFDIANSMFELPTDAELVDTENVDTGS